MAIVYAGTVYMSKSDLIMLSGVHHNFKHNELSSMKVYTWISLHMYIARFELSFIFVSAEFGYRFA